MCNRGSHQEVLNRGHDLSGHHVSNQRCSCRADSCRSRSSRDCVAIGWKTRASNVVVVVILVRISREIAAPSLQCQKVNFDVESYKIRSKETIGLNAQRIIKELAILRRRVRPVGIPKRFALRRIFPTVQRTERKCRWTLVEEIAHVKVQGRRIMQALHAADIWLRLGEHATARQSQDEGVNEVEKLHVGQHNM